MIGGSCSNFKIRMGHGLGLDINSAHPSAMCNYMPYEAISMHENPDFVEYTLDKITHTDNYFCYF
jgi:hypothetical protein